MEILPKPQLPKAFFELTAGDMMCREPIVVRERMPLRNAARILLGACVHGAPVVNDSGKCVGMLSMSDLARWGLVQATPVSPLPITCSFQDHHRDS